MIIGHQRIWDALTCSANKNRLAHAYLFCGSPQVGKATLAKEFIKWLFCQQPKNGQSCGVCRSCQEIASDSHPDLLIISPGQSEEKSLEIGIKQIRDLQHRLLFYPYKSSHKAVIIEEAHNLTKEAANAFLKTLEEPGAKSLIILTSSSWDLILPTIQSRCQLIKFLPVCTSQLKKGLSALGAGGPALEKILRLASGRPGYAKRLLKNRDLLSDHERHLKKLEDILKSDLIFRFEIAKELSQDIPLAKEALAWWLFWLRDRLLEASGRPDIVTSEEKGLKTKRYSLPALLSACREVKSASQLLANPSFNARLVLENLLMKI